MKWASITEAEAHAFYDSPDPASFGTLLKTTLASNYDKYHCPSAKDVFPESFTYKNCSAEYLANSQWGQSMITLDPPAVDAFYFPIGTTQQGTDETLSVNYWGV